jgi:phytoene dehydrogenase-like protein
LEDIVYLLRRDLLWITLSPKRPCLSTRLHPLPILSTSHSFWPDSNHSYWEELYNEPERYETEKKDIALKVIAQLERRLPGISGQIEVIDVSTPITVERYTGNWQGSMEGWMLTTDNMLTMMMGKGMDKTLPGLDGFFMIGQWVEPGGGVSTAAISGRGVIGMICKRDGKEFSTSLHIASMDARDLGGVL